MLRICASPCYFAVDEEDRAKEDSNGTRLCQNSNEADLGELFVQVHAYIPGIPRSNHACKKLNCSTKQLVRVLTQARPKADIPLLRVSFNPPPAARVCLARPLVPSYDLRTIVRNFAQVRRPAL
jgi:hypothetical protein